MIVDAKLRFQHPEAQVKIMGKPHIDFPSAKLQELCRGNQIRRLAVFGSALRDDFGTDSDVDMLVEFDPDANVGLRFFEIEYGLSQLVGRRVDLNTPGFLSRHFREEVLKEAQDIYVAP